MTGHKRKLLLGEHCNAHLQRAWDKHGERRFEFSVIEFCRKSSLVSREQLWMDKLSAYSKGFNARPTANNMQGIKWSPETNERRRLSVIRGGKLRGRKHSEQTKCKIRKAVALAYADGSVRKKISRALRLSYKNGKIAWNKGLAGDPRCKGGLGHWSFEALSALAKRRAALKTPKQRSDQQKLAYQTRMKNQNITHEMMRNWVKQGWITRRANAASEAQKCR